MSITGTSCRRGTSTILGTLIFIGIIFTSFIPMMLLMSQADMLYDMRKHELTRFDEERTMENTYFYLEPTEDVNGPVLKLNIINSGELAVRIERVWINDDLRDGFDCIIPSMSDTVLPLGDLIGDDPPAFISYNVIAVTDRGTILSPIGGIPTLNSATYEWTMDDFTIYIMMSQPTNSLHIKVDKKDESGVYQEMINEPVLSHRSIYEISVLAEGTYCVTVYRFYGQTPEEILLNGEIVVLSLLKSSDVVWVPA